MINITGLHKALGGRPVLKGVDLSVEGPETLVIMGPSGTGKSVLLKHVVGLMDPDEGDITVDGISVPNANRREIERVRESVSYVFQNSALFDSMTVRGNLCMGLPKEETRSDDMTACEEKARAAIERVNLEMDVLDLYPAELSGGMQRRVGIARAIIGDRPYILFDEPTTGLDPVNTQRMVRLISAVSSQLKTTSIVVTHDVASAFFLADRIALLMNGVIQAEGEPDDLRRTTNPIVRRFLDAVPNGAMA